MRLPVTKRGMVQTALGSIFYLMNDGRNEAEHSFSNNEANTPILCFHMSPRSSDEYLEVLPLLACSSENNNGSGDGNGSSGRAIIAFDIPGYGSSENPLRSCTIDEVSDAFLMVADSLLSDGQKSANFITVGSLMGNFFCMSLASRYPERIRAGILTNPWYNPNASKDKNAPKMVNSDAAIHDSYELKDDGSHLVELHSKRSKWLDPELNFRVVHSEIAYLANRRKRYLEGISMEGGNEYDFETPAGKIVDLRGSSSTVAATTNSCCSFLCIKGEACATMFDQYGLDGTKRFEEACRLITSSSGNGCDNDGGIDTIVQVEMLTGEKSTLNVINQMPEEFAALCNKFLSERGL